MKRLLLPLLIIVVVIVLVISCLWLFRKPSVSNNTGSSSTTTFPVSSTKTTTTSTANSNSQMTILNQNSQSVTVNDFVHSGDTIPDTENPGNYLLAGSLGYCLPNMKCTAGTATDYSILYDSKSQTFTVALLSEPLGQSRTDAEDFLLKTLGITQQQLCTLNYYVGTTYDVNEEYDSENLGFSFCPGAVQLPS